jgi:predicted nucleic acid-binding Zn ribbon protein
MLITYSFECGDCGSSFSLDMQRVDYHIPLCPKCGKNGVYRDFGADQIMVKDAAPRTVGALAEKNSLKQGIYR